MAEEQPKQLPEAPFPAPPPFWRYFTASHEKQLKEIESSEESLEEKLPLHLTYLRPPPPPPTSAEHYTTFGQKQVLDPTKPSSLPTDQLLFNPDDPEINLAALLSRLTKSLLLNFLELTSVLSLDPTKHEEKMEDIRQLLVNCHVVINMYRPHQARESVKEMLETMLEDGQREINDCDRLQQKVEEFLDNLGTSTVADIRSGATVGGFSSAHDAPQDQKIETQRRMWKMIHEMNGT